MSKSLENVPDMYAALAEALAEPAEWMTNPGVDWPLFELAMNTIPNSIALPGLVLIPAEGMPERQKRYNSLFGNLSANSETGQPRFWLYESAFLTGRILGAATFAVARIYSQAGLVVEGSELPDGAAQELSFLAHLAASPARAGVGAGVRAGFLSEPTAEKNFIKSHAGLWLPDLGLALAHGSDPVYAAIGQLLYDFLNSRLLPTARQTAVIVPSGKLPSLARPSECTLCGFCTQRCPSRALFIQENASHTSLVLNATRCNGCGRCAKVCDAALLEMTQQEDGFSNESSKNHVLRVSERVICKSCGTAMVSRAEMDYVINQIGHPAWLDYCQSCKVPSFKQTGA